MSTCCGDAVESNKAVETSGRSFDNARETKGCEAASSSDVLVLGWNIVDVNVPVGTVHYQANNTPRINSCVRLAQRVFVQLTFEQAANDYVKYHRQIHNCKHVVEASRLSDAK